jgi:hypothetical protein
MKHLLAILFGAALAISASAAQAAPVGADVVFVVDESGSMAGEHAFLGDVINDLDNGLAAAGITTRRYGLVGFGASNPQPRDVGGGFLNAAGFATATGNLQIGGGFEDGYAGLDFSLGNFAFNPNHAINFILVTCSGPQSSTVRPDFIVVFGPNLMRL